MTLYSVYERPHQPPVLVADSFSSFAAVLPPVYALVHRLWLLLAGWLVGVLALVALGPYIGDAATCWIYVALAVLVGLEAPTLRRVQLGRRGWHYRSELFAASEDLAMVDWLQRR